MEILLLMPTIYYTLIAANNNRISNYLFIFDKKWYAKGKHSHV